MYPLVIVYVATLFNSIVEVQGIPIPTCTHGVDLDIEGNQVMCSVDSHCRPGYACTGYDKDRSIGRCCRTHQEIFCDYGQPEQDTDGPAVCGKSGFSRCSSNYECVLFDVYGSELGLCCPKRPQSGQKPLHTFLPKVKGKCPASFGCPNGGRMYADCDSDSRCPEGKKCCQIACAKICVLAHTSTLQTRDVWTSVLGQHFLE